MKKLFFTAIFLMVGTFIFSQSLEKGNLVGVHVVDLKLKPNVTEDQAVNFVLDKLIPAWEKNYGTEEFLMKGVRGEFAGKYALLAIFKDEKARDKFYANTKEAAEASKQIEEAMKDLTAEADKLWYPSESKYNDYVVAFGKGEEIKKGALIGLHNEALKLNQGYNEQQYIEYYTTKLIPVWESYVPDCKVNISKSIRGVDSTKIGAFYIFNNESARAKLWDDEGNGTQYYKDFQVKYQDLLDGWTKIATREDTYTDWIVL